MVPFKIVIMKALKLMIVTVILILSGCVTDIEEILEKIDSENTGHMYIYTAPSVQPELAHMRVIRESDDVRKSQVLSRLVRFHTERTNDMVNQFRNGDEVMIAIKKPPRPCPPPSSCFEGAEFISFFTVNPHDRLQISVNDIPVKTKHFWYDDLTKIQTLRIPGKLKFKTGDVLLLKIDVSYPDANNKVKREVLDWRIQTSM